MDSKKFEWIIEGNTITTSFNSFKATINMPCNDIKDYQLLIIRNGEEMASYPFSSFEEAMSFAEEVITKFYNLKEVMKKYEDKTLKKVK